MSEWIPLQPEQRQSKFKLRKKCAKTNPLLSKENMKARLKFVRKTKTRTSGTVYSEQISVKLNGLGS